MTRTGILLTGEYVWYKVILRFISFLFKSIWLFFPAILFVVLGVLCFWILGQGKDVIVAFGENPRAKIYFVLAVALWAYMSWFTSRIVAYQKLFKQGGGFTSNFDYAGYERKVNVFSFELPAPWLEIFPRVLGFACFLVIELALLQLKYYGTPGWSTVTAIILLWALLFIYLALNNRLSKFSDGHRQLMKGVFFTLCSGLVLLLVIIWSSGAKNLMIFFWMVVLLHIVYVVYIHRRRTEMKHAELRTTANEQPHIGNRVLYWLMDRLYLPRVESVYFFYFIIVALVGIVVYILAIVKLKIAVNIGPFPLVLLAFSVLLGFGNATTIVSVRTGINWHVIILLFAVLLGSHETHYVRMADQSKDKIGIYKQRQGVIDYFSNWIKDSARGNMIDTSSKPYNIYFVLSNGGASRSGYWTAAVLGRLEDATRGTQGWFSQHLFCLSGASGGSVGNATFFSMLDSSRKLTGNKSISFTKGASAYLANDFLSYTLARMLGPDYFKYIFHFTWLDRAGALENSLEDVGPDSLLQPNMKASFSSILALKQQQYKLPIFCLNVTRMQDGNPGVVSNVKLDSLNFNNRIDVLELMPDDKDISMSTATILGARFPYISPAGRIDEDSTRSHYFVDGGYFDNSGAGIVQEMMRLINNYVRTSADPIIKSRAAKLRYCIIHITNGPVGSSILYSVSPLKNDVAAPLLTVIGAYDMQTTVNDQRLRNFLKDIDSMGPAKAAYYPIHLYKEYFERDIDSATGKRKKEDPYPMNWFISDTIRHRMDERLLSSYRLNQLIRGIQNQ